MSKVDFYNLFAERKAGRSAGWQWFSLMALDNDAILLEGLVPTAFFVRGPRKGKPNFSRSDKSTMARVVMTKADFVAIKQEWETETGLCSACLGTGKKQIQWPSRGDASFLTCAKCGGSGKALPP